jgi:hypothetical protein
LGFAKFVGWRAVGLIPAAWSLPGTLGQGWHIGSLSRWLTPLLWEGRGLTGQHHLGLGWSACIGCRGRAGHNQQGIKGIGKVKGGGRLGSRFAYGCVRLRGSEFQSFIQPTKLPRSALSNNSWSSPSSLCWIRPPTASLACGCQSAQGFSGGVPR